MSVLTARDYEVLSFMSVLPDRTCSVASLHNRFTQEVAEYELDRLYSLKLVESAEYAPFDGVSINLPVSYCVTTEGVIALADHLLAADHQRKQDAQEHEKTRADALKSEEKEKKSFRRELLIAVISSLTTLAVEHCVEIVNFIVEFINRLIALFH